MQEKILDEMFLNADEKYKKFHAALCPNTDNIIGVRTPILKSMAKEISKGNYKLYLETAHNNYYEEIMLQGFVIGSIKADFDEVIEYVKGFIPKIYNWAVCDGFCASLKITKKHMSKMWDFILPYLDTDDEFQIRFAVVMMLDYFVNEEYIHKVINLLDNIKNDSYYVQMAIAWAVSLCFIRFPKITMEYLKSNSLDDFTYNKSLQKILDSFRVDDENKDIIRTMKRK